MSTDATSAYVERVGDGLLVTFDNGATLHFSSIENAQTLATNILMVCAFGQDQIDTLTTDIEGDNE